METSQAATPQATILADSRTIALNRDGKLSPEQLRQLGTTISLSRWLLYPLGVALAVDILLFGFFDGAMGASLHFSVQSMAALYALLIAGFFLSLPLIVNGEAAAQFVAGLVLMVLLSLFVLAATRNVQLTLMCGLMYSMLVAIGGLAQIGQGNSRDTPLPRFITPIAVLPLLCFVLWLLGSLVLLALFMINGYWMGPAIVFAVFYAIFVWAFADDYFKGRAQRREAVVPRLGEVTWDASKGKFIARVGGHVYHFLGPLPQPGLYRFYCLTSISYAVAAEPLTDVDLAMLPATSSSLASALDPPATLPSASERAARLVLLKSLMRSLKFRESDLAVNQRGRVSWRQFIKRAVPQIAKLCMILYATAVAGLLLGFILAQIPSIADGFAAIAAPVNLIGFAATLALVALAGIIPVAVVGLYLLITRARRIVDREVIQVDGEVTSAGIQGITDPSWSLMFAPGPGRAFPPGMRYRFFVRKVTGDILSAIPLTSGAA